MGTVESRVSCVREAMISVVGSAKEEKLWGVGVRRLGGLDLVVSWYVDLLKYLAGEDSILDEYFIYKTTPVDVVEFVESREFLCKKNVLYPVVMEAFIEVCSGDYIELVATGGIGCGKTTLAQYVLAYKIYELSCMWDAHSFFRLDSASEILFIFQSLNYSLAQTVEYKRFRALLDNTYYFTKVFPFNKDIESRLVFPNRIEVVPVSGDDTAAIGQNVFSGIIDEVNYMSIIKDSKQSVDGGEYHQAWALYNSIARRRKSRFTVGGRAYGMLCLCSSKRFPGQFTDVKEEEAKRQIAETGKTNIFIYDKRVWEVKPEGAYTGTKWFKVFVGTDFLQPFIINSDVQLTAIPEEYRTDEYIIDVPEEYKVEFERDLINALREIAGVSTLAKNPYMPDTAKVSKCFGRVDNIFSRQSIVFGEQKLKIRIPKPIKEPCYAHIDLSKTTDHTGICVGYVSKFVQVDVGGSVEVLPEIKIIGALEVIAPVGGEIEFSKVRQILYSLRKLGVNLKWVSYDSYQSVDSLQILKGKGFITGVLSVDTDIKPYKFLKSALYDGRVYIPEHETLFKEVRSVEFDAKKGKVDHPAGFSKDVADALAGVVYGLTVRKEIWSRHAVKPSKVLKV